MTLLEKLEDQTYFDIKAVSSHNIMSFFFPQKQFKQNPKYFQQGTYVHAKSLESPEIAEEIITKRCNDLHKSDIAQADVWVDNLAKNIEIAKVMPRPEDRMGESIYTEVVGSATYTNKKGAKLPLKGKFDLINTDKKYIVDVKTTSSLANFEDSIVKYAYQIQAAFYLKLANTIDPEGGYKDFFWAVVDKKTGQTKLIRCSDEYVEDGNYYIDLYLENPPTFLPF